jgi:hypothetical protein
MAFAQLTYRESLRDSEACRRAQPTKLYHLGLRGNVSRAALSRRQGKARLAHVCTFGELDADGWRKSEFSLRALRDQSRDVTLDFEVRGTIYVIVE